MANTTFEVDKELFVQGSGSLGQALRIIGNNTLSNAITKSIQAFQEIDVSYKKAVANDGKIIGTERSDILFRTDILFDLMIISWKILSEGETEYRIKIENKKNDFNIDIIESNGIWKLNGHLTPNMNKPVKNFTEIYNTKLAPEVINLLQNYKKACEDGVLDGDEKELLKKGIKQVLYYVLFLRFQLEKCLINN